MNFKASLLDYGYIEDEFYNMANCTTLILAADLSDDRVSLTEIQQRRYSAVLTVRTVFNFGYKLHILCVRHTVGYRTLN